MLAVRGGHLLPRTFLITTFAVLLVLFVVNVSILWSPLSYTTLSHEWLPSVAGKGRQQVGDHVWQKSKEPGPRVESRDQHPIKGLRDHADHGFRHYEGDRSKTFEETVAKYRARYGRHPPPGFKDWYKFARKRNVHNIDDFQQIHDDLRPFWAIPPADIRRFAAHASDDPGHLIGTVSLRDGNVFQELWGWRSETFVKMLRTVAKWLPDMDIPINRMDQPRVVVHWEEMQEMLKVEETGRSLAVQGVEDGFSRDMAEFYIPNPQNPEPAWVNRWNPFIYPKEHERRPDDPQPAYEWFPAAGQQYMDLASKACPPESYARNPESASHLRAAEASYKHPTGGFVTNFNLSSDLCTVGPQLSHQHGLLYASTSMLATHKLVPIFGECKVNVNNDILFPANMYWMKDPRYLYADEQDISWDDKQDVMPWRGVTSGGTGFGDQPEHWRSMHRHRLVFLTNSTELADNTTSVLALSDAHDGAYSSQTFHPAGFAHDHTDVGFTEKTFCIPNCGFYNDTLTFLKRTSFADTFKSKYLIDVDGHSFSGRWRAFLQSRSLGLKATIFREWHDSRLWAWKHFVPVDNRYGELYSLLTYFIGVGSKADMDGGGASEVTVPPHDFEAYQMAREGREQAAKVLRAEDIEIYLFRLLLEYGRLIDDARDSIGFVGDGGEEMRTFDREVPAME